MTNDRQRDDRGVTIKQVMGVGFGQGTLLSYFLLLIKYMYVIKYKNFSLVLANLVAVRLSGN